jgi:hypothetical protein
MAEFWFNDGSPRKARELYYNDGTAVRKIKEAWYNDGTGVRKVFSGFTPLSGITLASETVITNINPQIRFESDGTVRLLQSDNSTITDNWGLPTTTGAGADYTLTVASPTGSGAGACTGTFNSAQSLSSELVYTMSAATFGSARSATCSYTIKDNGGATVATGTLVFDSDRS